MLYYSSRFLFVTLLMGVCWPEDVAGAQLHHSQSTGAAAAAAYPSYNNKNFNEKYNQHPHRHHHVADRHQQQTAAPSTSTTDYPSDAMADGLDYENEDNSDHIHHPSSVNDASSVDGGSSSSGSPPLMGLLPEPGTYIPSNCTSCIQREELRRRNLEVIKDQILSKLGMQRAPNMTGRLPPRIPPLDHLLDLYGMQGDAPPGHGRGNHGNHGNHHHHQQSDQAFQTGPVYDEEEDDFHARTEKVIAFSQHCKCPTVNYFLIFKN